MKEDEQPAKSRSRKAGTSLIEQSANNWQLADASAIQAVSTGTASPEQQKRAINWILKRACMLPEWPYQPGANDRDTNIALGRQLVGHQIVKLQNADLQRIRRNEPNADQPEPKS